MIHRCGVECTLRYKHLPHAVMCIWASSIIIKFEIDPELFSHCTIVSAYVSTVAILTALGMAVLVGQSTTSVLKYLNGYLMDSHNI